MFVLVCIGLDPYQKDKPVLRPALVVNDWGNPDGYLNVQLFLDGSNDDHVIEQLGRNLPRKYSERGEGPFWLTSVTKGDGVGQWRRLASPYV